MNGRGRTVLGTCCGSCFLPNSRVFARMHCEKPHFPRYLDVGLSVSVLCPPIEGGKRPSGTQTKNVLKGIARVDDPFGARWSA